MIADVVVGLQHGDEGKGKVTHQLASSGEYTHVLRFNGGCNAGHTIYHLGKKFVTHHIPAGVFYGVKSIIGPGCVINIEKLFKEIKGLESEGINVRDYLYVAGNAHVITAEHMAEDAQDTKIGTTKSGNGPAYRDKYSRVGLRAENCPELAPFIVDLYSELHKDHSVVVLCEGAQGFGLDIDWGDYPYVTSSHCTVGGAVSCGIPHNAIRNVWGVAKAYETYVGAKKFESSDPIFSKIRDVGSEYGATTGRPRQVNWLNIEDLKKSVDINGVTQIVFNKCDILDSVKCWKVITTNGLINFKNATELESYLKGYLHGADIIFSRSPNKI